MLEAIVTFIGISVIVLLWVILYDSNRFVVRKYAVRDKRIKKRCVRKMVMIKKIKFPFLNAVFVTASVSQASKIFIQGNLRRLCLSRQTGI